MRARPTRPLGDAYWWILLEDGAYLHFNQGCVASVAMRDGQLTTVIRFQRHVHEARCASIEQGMRWIERWLEKQKGKGPPGLLVKGPRWYQRRSAPSAELRELEREILGDADDVPRTPHGRDCRALSGARGAELSGELSGGK